jgi:hypothetical protein
MLKDTGLTDLNKSILNGNCSTKDQIFEKINDELGLNKKSVMGLDNTWIHPAHRVCECSQDHRTDGVIANDSVGQHWTTAHASCEKSSFLQRIRFLNQ